MAKISQQEVEAYYSINVQMSKLKKQREILGRKIKENILPNEKIAFGDLTVYIALSERTILDTKKIKEEYPRIYEAYGKIQEVKTLTVKESI